MSRLGVTVVGLAVAFGFAACGGLDDRRVTRGNDASAGTAGSSGSSQGGSAGAPSEGGSGNLAGSGFEGGAPSVDGAPRVVAVTPEGAEADVDSLASVRVRFSEALDEATVTSSSVQLLLGEEPVVGALSYAGGTVTFEPDERLALLAEYEVRVSTDVQDADGVPLDAAFSSRFTVREGAWTTEEPIIERLADDEYWASDVALGADEAGNALTAWVQQSAGKAPTLRARWHRPGVGWEAAAPLHTASAATDALFYPSVAVSPTGDAALAWFEQTQSGYWLWVARYLDGEWGRPERAEGASGTTATGFPPQGPLVAMSGDRTVVAWLRQEFVGGDTGAYYYLEANDADHGQPFASTPQLAGATQGGTGNYIGWASLGMDAGGNSLLVFSDYQNGVGTVHYSKYAAGTRAWSFDSPIAGASPVRSGPYIQMSADGAAAVVYSTDTDVSATAYTKAKGFTAPVVIDSLDTPPYLSSVSPIATDGRRFLATWHQQVGTTANTYAAILAEGAWSPAELLSDGDISGNGFPVPVADVQGNLTVVWSQAGPPNFDVYFARRPWGASAWQSPQALSVTTPRPYSNFGAAAAVNGTIALALPVTYQSSGPTLRSQPYFALFQ